MSEAVHDSYCNVCMYFVACIVDVKFGEANITVGLRKQIRGKDPIFYRDIADYTTKVSELERHGNVVGPTWPWERFDRKVCVKGGVEIIKRDSYCLILHWFYYCTSEDGTIDTSAFCT